MTETHTQSRARLITQRIKAMASLPAGEQQIGVDGIRHLLWISLESGDNATIELVGSSLNFQEMSLFKRLLNEAALEPMVRMGERHYRSQLVAFPMIIEAWPNDLPGAFDNHIMVANEIARRQDGGRTRGLYLAKDLFSFGEISSIPHHQLYRYAIESVKATCGESAANQVECAEHESDHFAVHFQDGRVIALRIALATVFSSSQENYGITEAGLNNVKQLMEFDYNNTPYADLKVHLCEPARIDKAMLNAIPEFYRAVTRKFVSDIECESVKLIMDIDGTDWTLSVKERSTTSHFGIPVFIPNNTEDKTESVIGKIRLTCQEHDVAFGFSYAADDKIMKH